MKVKIFITLITFIGILSCEKNKEDAIVENTVQPTDYELITGLYCYDETAQVMASYGNPNNKTTIQATGEDSFNERDMSSVNNEKIVIYPNPVAEHFNIHTNVEIKNIWILKGKAQNIYQDVDFSDLYSKQVIDTIGISKACLMSLNSGNLVVNVSTLKTGFYKVIIETNENKLAWTSIYKGAELSYEKFKEIWK
jgi:hypothetical protein